MSNLTHESNISEEPVKAKLFADLPDYPFDEDPFNERIKSLSPDEIASEYVEIQTEIKLLDKQANKLRHELIKQAKGDKTVFGPLQIIKCVKKGVIDNDMLYTDFEMLTGDSIESYRKKPTEYWTVRAIDASSS